MYNKNYMKYPLFAILVAAFIAIYPVSAQEKVVTTVPAVEPKTVLKTEPLTIKKQKIEEGLASTIEQLSLVIARTQTAIDLLSKNGKDTTSAQESLEKSKASLETAQATLEGLFPVADTEKKEVPAVKITPVAQKTKVLSFKDQVKKIQDTLKDSRSSLIDSITALKESLIQKEIAPEE